MSEFSWEPIEDIAKSVQTGGVTAVSLVEKALERAKQTKDYNSILQLIENRSIERAKQIDVDVIAGKAKGRLLGVPFVAKDNFLTFDSQTTAASNILKGFEAPYQSTAIERLEAEGAICIAKANLDAFAHGGSTENSDFGPTKNPVDPEYVPGGSSGGSATAVVLGIAPFALGTDTGGSIRQPASFTGSVGLKPSYGLVSRYGVIAMASSTDCIGPLTSRVQDAALVLDVMAGKDERDSTTIERSKSYVTEKSTIKKIALVKEYLDEGVSDEVRLSITKAIDKLKLAGITVEEVSLPSVKHALAAYYILSPAEISSNLARYDGVKFGYRADADSLESMYAETKNEGFNYENKRRIMIGAYVLSSGYYEAYYQKAQKVRTMIINDFKSAFEKYDLLIGPTSPTTAFKLGELSRDPVGMYLQDVLNVGASLAGLPAISVPIEPEGEMPVGLQIIGKHGRDSQVLQLASQVEETQNG